MTENSYLLGIDTSAKLSIAIGIILFILLTIMYFSSELDSSPDNDSLFKKLISIFFFIFLLLILSIGVSIAFFLIIYPFINLILQKFLTLNFYTREVSQGTLGLRITSILLGFNFLKSSYNFWADTLAQNHEDLTAEYVDLQNINPFMTDTEINFIILSQNLIYGAVTLLLWIFIFLSKSSKSLLELRVVIWGLFFIIDDWSIISDNLIALKGRVLKWHRLRIIFFNALLVAFLVSACFRQLNHTPSSIVITLILSLLIIFNGIFFFKTSI